MALLMTWTVLGAGYVGSFLGALGGAGLVLTRGPRRVEEQVLLPDGRQRTWRPQVGHQAGTPCLIACRCHQSPWENLPAGPVLAAQNGLGQPVPVAVCFMAISRTSDGVLSSRGPEPRVVVSSLHSLWRPVVSAWREAGLVVEEVPDVTPHQWEKAILNATVGPLCLITSRTVAEVWSDPELRQLVMMATTEGAQIAAGEGVVIPAGIEARASHFFARMGTHQPSVLRGAGELPWIIGRLLAAAERQRLPVPALSTIATSLSSSGTLP